MATNLLLTGPKHVMVHQFHTQKANASEKTRILLSGLVAIKRGIGNALQKYKSRYKLAKIRFLYRKLCVKI